MIPGLLHQRLLGGGIADPPTYDGVDLFHDRTGFGSGPIEAGGRVIFRSNGTWAIETIQGAVQASGNWYQPTTTGIGANYEIRYTVTQTDGSGVGITTTNPAATYIGLGSLRTLTIKNSQAINGGRHDLFDVLVEIRELVGGAVVATGTIVVDLNAELNI